MTKQIELNFELEDVFQRVEETVAYIASKGVNAQGVAGADYEKIATVEADRDLFGSLALGVDAMVAGDLGSMFVELGGEKCVVVEVSDGFPEHNIPAAEVGLAHVYVNSIVARWCELVRPELAQVYTARAVEHMDMVKRILRRRRGVLRRPSREMY